jgi:hypothetical protein
MTLIRDREAFIIRSATARLLLALSFALSSGTIVPLGAQEAATPAQPAQASEPTTATPAKKPGTQIAEGLENWKAGIDLSAYPPGKYNLVVQGMDEAGNLTQAAPMNIYVDPASDLPRVTVVNPAPLLRVGGDLNIVGTCADDDGVGKVEVSVDGGEYRPAEGTEFWSLYLKTADLSDGRRTIDVHGVDVNGLVGKSVHVAFDLDRAKPIATVSSPATGSIVAGQIRLEGKVFDLNGVSSLDISTDGGETYAKVDLRKGKDPTNADFSFAVDTRKLGDGPRVFWLKSVDGVGSMAKSAFLVFVDNTKPAIEIARPAPGQAVNGRFSVAGAVRDVVGVKRLAYVFAGGQEGEISLTKGDPYFVKEFDAGAVKGDKVDLVLVAEDAIGNVTRLMISPKIDRRADMPALSVVSPVAGGTLRRGDRVWGSIRDDDGVSAVRWSLDGAAPSEAPCSETFSIALPGGIRAGKHLLALTPVDANGVAGDKVEVAFSLDLGPGTVRFERLVGAKAERDFVSGIEVSVDGGEALAGAVTSPNPLVRLSYALGDSNPRPLPFKVDGETCGFSIPIDRSFPYGFVAVSVRAEDGEKNTYGGKTLVYVKNYGAVREDTGFRFVDPRAAVATAASPARVDLASGGELLGAFYREELESMRFDPSIDIAVASFEGMTVRVAARKEGVSPPTLLIARTKRGHEFTAGPFVFITDRTGPKLSVENQSAWFSNTLKVSGAASDPSGLASIAYRVMPKGMTTAGDQVQISPKTDGSFSFILSAAEMPQGPAVVEIEARDAAGNASRVGLCVGVDAEPPHVRFAGPEAGAEVWGPEDILALVDDESGIASVEYAEDGGNFEPIEWNGGFFAHRADLASHPSAAYRVVDLAGNKTVIRPDVRIVARPARMAAAEAISVEPESAAEARVELAGTSGSRRASLVLPGLGEAAFKALGFAEGSPPPERFATRLAVSGAVSLKGQASVGTGESAQIKAVSLSLDGGASYAPIASYKDQKSAKPSLPFSLSVPAASLTQGEARWLVKMEDFAGASFLCPIYALVDIAAPSLSIVYPEAGTTSFPGPFPLLVKAHDENGLASAEFASGVAGSAKETLDTASGGRYFVRIADPVSLPKGGTGLATFSVRDAAGNAASAQLRYGYDAAGDLPTIALADIKPKLAAGDLVSGGAADDDGIPELSVSVDDGEATLFAAGSFALVLPELPGGKHTLAVRATDSSGRRAETKRDIVIIADPPSFDAIELGDAKSRSPWSPGAAYALGPGSMVSGNVFAANGLASVELSVGDGQPIKATIGKAQTPGAPTSFSAPLPAALPYDRILVSLRAIDTAGMASEARCEIHRILPSGLKDDDGEALRFEDERITSAEDGATFLLAPGDRIVGRFNGRPIERLWFKPAASVLAASFDGAAVSIDAKEEGIVSGAELVARTVDGDEFSWGPFTARVDGAPPELAIDAPADGDWEKLQVRVAGKASDPNGVPALEVSVNGGKPESLVAPDGALLGPVAAADARHEVVFDRIIDIASVADGSIRLDFLVRDGAGRESRESRFINKDTLPPELAQILPAAGESVNGTMTVVIEAKDGGRLGSAAFVAAAGQAPEDVAGLDLVSKTLDFARLSMPLAEGSGFVVRDKAGNEAALRPDLVVDREKDKPISEIHTPLEMEVLRGDFAISGVAYDDDGLAAAYYRIDSGEWKKLAMDGTSYNVPILLKDTTDNEHLVEVKAEDIYGVQGDIVSRHYRISKEEPAAVMTNPPIAKPSRGIVELVGSSSDANGIGEISVSLDSRVSYNRPSGTESWRYLLDTRALADGLHPVSIRPVDTYETEGFYASIIYIDNTPPVATIDLPADGDTCHRSMLVSGRVSDNLALASSRIEIAPVGQSSPPELVVELGTEGIVRRLVDVAALRPGQYTVRIVARDRADNETFASRDVAIAGGAPPDRVDLIYPLEGSMLGGRLVVYGRAEVSGNASDVSVRVGGAEVGSAQPDARGYFAFEVPAAALADGTLSLSAVAATADGRSVASRDVRVEWKRLGPWISIDSFPAGRYIPYRPYLEGRSGWAADAPSPADKAAVEAFRKAEKDRAPVAVEISLDNGRSFHPASGTGEWRFRLETQDYPEGGLYIIARCRFKDESTAYAKTLLFLDKTPPEVNVAMPVENGRYNGVLSVSGIASDANGLDSVTVSLRKGDKKSYAVPAFIQGLYLDGQVIGATTWSAGLGLTFFDDNVKLQAGYGTAPTKDASGAEQRFYGDVFSAKVIANIGLLPFNALFGPDWDFLSASLGIGADFSYFGHTQSGESLIVSAVIAQFEFPKIRMRDWKAFKTFALYTEAQIWVVSSDVQGGFIPRLSFGGRIGVF